MTSRHLVTSHFTFSRGGVAAVAALALATGAVPLLATEARADSTGLTLTAPDHYTPVQDTLYAAGDTGYLHRRATDDGSTAPYQWRSYDGTERTVEGYTGTLPGQQGNYGAGTDVLPVASDSYDKVRLLDPATGESSEITVPAGQTMVGSFGRTVLTASYNEVWQVDKVHILRDEDGDGVTTDTVVDPPELLRFAKYPVLAGDGRSVLLKFTRTHTLGLLDLTTGEVTAIPTNVRRDDQLPLQAVLSPTHIAWYQDGMDTARVVRRDDPTGAQTAVTVPVSEEGAPVIGLAGDWLLTSYRSAEPTEHNPPLRRGGPLRATPFDGGPARTLLDVAQPDLQQIPGGGAITVGGADAGDWAVRRVEVAADGTPSLRTLDEVPSRSSAVVRGVALAAGQLVTKEADSAPRPAYVTRKVTLTGTPVAGPRAHVTTAPYEDTYGQPLGTGDGSVVHVRHDAAAQRDVLVRATASGERTEMVLYDRTTPESSGRILRDAAGRYAVFGGGGFRERSVVDLAASGGPAVVQTVNTSAAAVWGGKLWTTDGTWGRIESRDLATSQVTPYTVDAACEIQDLQAVGRWVYWDCMPPGGSSPDAYDFGVYDRETGRNIELPERGRLGDGFVVGHEAVAGKLRLTDFHTGVANVPRVLGDLPAVSTWKSYDVDKFGGGVAWLDAAGTVHAVESGVPTQPLTATGSEADTSYVLGSAADWSAAWQLSKPASGATVVIKRNNKVIRTLDASATGVALSASWDGTGADGSLANTGTYSWTLTAPPEDGTGAALSRTGTITVTG
ncbi:FlgD immunoglobulin-like domain containing protein [Streptomyces sp. NPDC055749]